MAIPTPIAFWKMSSTTDELGTYNLTNTGSVTFSAGKIGNAANFDGTNKRLEISNTVGFNSSSTNTWGVWVKLNNTTGTQYLFDIIDNSSSRRVIVWWQNSQFTLYASGNTVISPIFSTSTYYFIRVTKTSGGSFELFVNEVSQGTVSQGTTGGTPTIFSIGTSGDGFGANSNSQIDAFGVWNVVLTIGEGSELYNGGNGLEYPFGITFIPRITII